LTWQAAAAAAGVGVDAASVVLTRYFGEKESANQIILT